MSSSTAIKHHHPQHLAEQRFTGARRTMIKNYH